MRTGFLPLAGLLVLTLLVATGCRDKPTAQTPPAKPAIAAHKSPPARHVGLPTLTEPVVMRKPPAEPLPPVQKVSRKRIRATLKKAQEALAAGRLDERDRSPTSATTAVPASLSSNASGDAAASRADVAVSIAPAAPDALSLYRNVLATDPKNATALHGVDAVVTALAARVQAELADEDVVDAQRDADRINLLQVDAAGATALKAALDKGWHVAGLIERGQRLELAGKLILPRTGNAAAAYREALALSPTSPTAEAGLERIENLYIGKALAAANDAQYPQSEHWLAQAALARSDSKALKEARARVSTIREEHAQLLAVQAIAAAAAGDPDQAEPLLREIERAAPKSPLIAQVRARIQIARDYGVFRPGEIFTDKLASNTTAPEMIVLPIGSFRMGAAANDPRQDPSEVPQRRIEFKHGFAMSRTEVTVTQFARFIAATHYLTDAEHSGYSMVYNEAKGKLDARRGVNWRDDYTGQRATADAPVMHVSWNDAQAYTIWLSRESAQLYRLPSEAEFEYGLRAGSTGTYPWPDTNPPADIGDLAGGGDTSPSGRHWGDAFAGYRDGFWGAAPVAHFAANGFGLYDMVGNLSEWTLDCWHDDYRRAPENASAWVNPGCTQRVVRGSSWSAAPDQSRSAQRSPADAGTASARIGFRVVREI